MGESNEASSRLIARVIGEEPETLRNDDGTISLRLGHIIITAEAALWSDPRTFLHEDGSLTVSWGGQRNPLMLAPATNPHEPTAFA